MYRVHLRLLKEEDLPLLLAWAHIPEIWTYLPTSRNGENLTWENHFCWFLTRSGRIEMLILASAYPSVIYQKQRPVGVIHAINIEEESPEVGLYIGEAGLWGQGVGKKALDMMLDYIFYYLKKTSVSAVIHPENQRSIKLFTSAGFQKVGEARKGQDLYAISLSDSPHRPESTVSQNQG